MLWYCLMCGKNIENKTPKVVKTKKGRIILFSKCAVCDSKNLKLSKRKKRIQKLKKQEIHVIFIKTN